jgi:hypothetical protein
MRKIELIIKEGWLLNGFEKGVYDITVVSSSDGYSIYIFRKVNTLNNFSL